MGMILNCYLSSLKTEKIMVIRKKQWVYIHDFAIYEKNVDNFKTIFPDP